MSELDDLLEQVQRIGVAGHVHEGAPDQGACGPDEVCISQPEPFTAIVRSPGRDAEVEVDAMTAYGVLSNLPDGAGLEPMWAELTDIDRAG